MLKNYLKIAFRNLWRNKAYATINILGLGLGIACSLLIFLWIQDEKSVDAFHKNVDQIYYVYETQFIDGKVDGGTYTPGKLPEELKKMIPEIQFSTGFAWTDAAAFAVDNKINKLNRNHASPDFFKIFSYKLLQGTPESVLKNPENIVISRKMAELFFGNPEQAMGKIIRYENRKNLMVSGVFENLPANVSDKFDCVLTWETFMDDNAWTKEWGNNGPNTLVMLRKDANPNKVEAKIKRFLDKYNKEQSSSFRIELGLFRFDKMYLHSNFKNGKPSGGRIEYLNIFGVVAIFILLIAGINFMNLATASSLKRTKEVGIRKVIGAIKSVLVVQFIGEAILLSFFAIALALFLVEVALPSFNTLTQKQIILPILEPFFWLLLVGFLLLIGLFSGSYPAFFLASLNPVRVLKGTLKFGSKANWFRKGLVVFQFMLSIILIIGTVVVSRQVDYIQNAHLGYDRENLIFIPLEGDLSKRYATFKQDALKNSEIKSISQVTELLTNIDNSTGGVDWDGKAPNTTPRFTELGVGYDFVKSMDLKILQGRDFDQRFATDSVGYLVNESALKIIAYQNPIGKRLTFWQKKGKIIGVLKDFHFQSLHQPILPLIIRLEKNIDLGTVVIRSQAGKNKEVLANLEKTCKQLNPKFPFTYYFADVEYQKLYHNEQIINILSNYFAILAIFIACLGLFGLSMFTAEQRIKEIGIRKVLGASVASILQLMSKDFLKLVIIAYALALPIAGYLMSNWLQAYAYRINLWSNWHIFAFAGLISLVIALFTIASQAYRAAIVNPVEVLKNE